MAEDQFFLRSTVIGGERLRDDFEIIWDGLTVGRIFKNTGRPADAPGWSWSMFAPNLPQKPSWRGDGADLDDCKRLFKIAWAEARQNFTDEDVAKARAHEASLAARPWNRRR
jgi:hypothetical protein